jgi:chromosome partitioning protein
MLQSFAPDMKKVMRDFPATEAASLLGASQEYVRKCHRNGTLPEPENSTGSRRTYSALELWKFRQKLDAQARTKGTYLPWRREGEPLQVWQFMNFKGGSAKTTTTVHMSHFLALQGFRVLLIDLDPQHSATGMCGIIPEHEYRDLTIYNALTLEPDLQAPMEKVIQPTFLPGLSIAPAGIRLGNFQLESRNGSEFATRLQQAIGSVADKFDVVLIDSPPQLDILTITGMVAATSVVVPLAPSMLDLDSTAEFLDLTSEFLATMAEHNQPIFFDQLKFLITRDEPKDGPSQKLVAFLRSLLSDHVMANTCLKSTAIQDATFTKQSIYELPKRDLNRETYDRVRSNMDDVGNELRQMIEGAWGREVA